MRGNTIWRFLGAPAYIAAAARRLGVVLDHVAASKSAEMHRCAVLVGQLADRFRRVPRGDDGAPVLAPREREGIAATLGRVRHEADKLHASAGAAEAMLDEAYRAWGLEPPRRPFRLAEDPPAPPGDDNDERPDSEQRDAELPRDQRLPAPDGAEGRREAPGRRRPPRGDDAAQRDGKPGERA